MHLGGIHRDFETVGLILDRMEAIKDDWKTFLPEFDHPQPGGFQQRGIRFGEIRLALRKEPAAEA